MKLHALYSLAFSALSVNALRSAHTGQEKAKWFSKRQTPHFPAPVTGYTTIHSPSGSSIRYKEPGKAGVCETTKGVKSYSGYIDLSPNMHAFFWVCFCS